MVKLALPIIAASMLIAAAAFPDGAAMATSLQTLHVFDGSDLSGALGNIAVVNGRGYGGGDRSVIELVPPTAPATDWRVNVIHSFAGSPSDGTAAAGGVIAIGHNLYGVTSNGGIISNACSEGCGIVYRLTPPQRTGDPWTETVLHEFTDADGDGGAPDGTLVADASGAIYGSTTIASNDDPTGGGTVFKLTPPAAGGHEWTETVLHHFTGASGDGFYPLGGLVLAKDGSLYGATFYGGSCRGGTLYHLLPPAQASGDWKEEIAVNIGAAGDASCDETLGDIGSDLRAGPDGMLYGDVLFGGPSGGAGAIYKFDPVAKIYKVIWGFGAIGDGAIPVMAPAITADGALYGTTSQGGTEACNCGVLYKLVPQRDGTYAETVLHQFTGKRDGAYPLTRLYQPPSGGPLYGATNSGAALGAGTIYRIFP